MNPKSITMEELYGGVDKLTLEWRDGLMAITVRQAVQASTGTSIQRHFANLVSFSGETLTFYSQKSHYL